MEREGRVVTDDERKELEHFVQNYIGFQALIEKGLRDSAVTDDVRDKLDEGYKRLDWEMLEGIGEAIRLRLMVVIDERPER